MKREIHEYEQEKAFCKEYLSYIDDAVYAFYIRYYTIDKAMREIQYCAESMRMELGY